jgi:hypothetical protein
MPIQLLLVSAAIFGPLTGWLAARRGRIIVAWFAFGVVLGPVATLLVLAAPPGRCPACETPTDGWLGVCLECGQELPGLLRATPPRAASAGGSGAIPEPSSATVLVRTTPNSPASRPDARALESARTFGWGRSSGMTPAGPPYGAAAAEEPRSIDSLAARRAGAAERVGAVRPINDAQSAGSEGASGAGQVVAPLLVGGRYVLTREGDEIVFSGPIERADSHIVRRPLSAIDVTLLDGRLMLTRRDASGSIVAVFQSLALYPGIDIEAELSPTMPLAAEQ